jgi:PII-like signaling protein
MLEVSIFLDEDDLYQGRRMDEHIVRYLMHHNIMGATVFSAAGGYGQKHHLNLPKRIAATDEGPLMIVFIDEDTKVAAVLPHIKEVVRGGLVITKHVDRV